MMTTKPIQNKEVEKEQKEKRIVAVVL